MSNLITHAQVFVECNGTTTQFPYEWTWVARARVAGLLALFPMSLVGITQVLTVSYGLTQTIVVQVRDGAL